MWTVSIITDEHCKPLAIGVGRATANSIKRHFRKQCSTNSYVLMINRKYCTNHADFEVER